MFSGTERAEAQYWEKNLFLCPFLSQITHLLSWDCSRAPGKFA